MGLEPISNFTMSVGAAQKKLRTHTHITALYAKKGVRTKKPSFFAGEKVGNLSFRLLCVLIYTAREDS